MKILELSKRITLLMGAAFLCASALVMAQAGRLDPSFGTGGIVTTPGTNTSCGQIAACGLAIQSDGKILVAGGAPDDVALARYNPNGSLDTTFGTGGLVITTTGGVSGPAFGLALQPDGKIVIGTVGQLDLLVIRYNTNGSLDTTFGSGGFASVRPFDEFFFSPLAGAIAVESNGDILVVCQAAAARFLSNGQLDSSFGTDGAAQLVSNAQALTLLPSGEFLVSSTFAPAAAARYTSAGALDTTFGVAGQIPSLGGTFTAPAAGGKLIAAGTLATAAEPPPAEGNPQSFVVVRYNATGAVDSTFGTLGGVLSSFPGNNYSAALAVAVQSNGEIVAGGETALNGTAFGKEIADFALARYTPNGQLDTTFGTGGLVTTAFGDDTAFVSALAIQSDGRIVAAGANTPLVAGTPNPGFTLARYLGE